MAARRRPDLALLWGALWLMVACSRAAVPETAPRAGPPPAQGQAEPSLPGLTVDEQQLAFRLEERVTRLSEIGPRGPKHPWALADAADYLAAEFEAMGFALVRQGYEHDGVAAQNLSVVVPGGQRGNEVLLVTAHYDAVSDDGRREATGVAALLEIARYMRDAKLTRTLELVAFAMGESPQGDGPGRGSRRYLDALLERERLDQQKLDREQRLRDRGELPESLPPLPLNRRKILGIVQLDRLGGWTEAPLAVELEASATGDKLISSLEAVLEEDFISLERHLLPALRPDWNPTDGDSDQAAFQEAGIPVAWVHGPPGRHAGDMGALARIVWRLRAGIGQIAGEKHLQGLGLP